MKDNKLIKSGVSGVVDGENQTVSDYELELINRYTRRNLEKSEVYAFSVVLCDNDVDRDGERFTTDSLYELENFLSARRELLTTIRVPKIRRQEFSAVRLRKLTVRKRLWVTITTGSRQGHIFPFVRATGILSLRLTAELSRK